MLIVNKSTSLAYPPPAFQLSISSFLFLTIRDPVLFATSQSNIYQPNSLKPPGTCF